MPLKLRNPEHHPLDGLIINKKVVSDMVKAYRTNHSTDPKALKFIHFNLEEVIQLFINNEVLDPDIPLSEQLADLESFGLKIYLGNHTDPSNCPPNAPSYLHRDTAILCNTQLNPDTKTWEDQLLDTSEDDENNNSVSILGDGSGLDRGSICPPNCPPQADPDGYFHQDVGTS